MATATRTSVPLPSALPGAGRLTSPLPPAAAGAMARLEVALSSADVAAHEAASYVRRRPVDRGAVIAEALRLLESGLVPAAELGDPLSAFAALERGSDGSGARGFAAFKLAQRLVGGEA